MFRGSPNSIEAKRAFVVYVGFFYWVIFVPQEQNGCDNEADHNTGDKEQTIGGQSDEQKNNDYDRDDQACFAAQETARFGCVRRLHFRSILGRPGTGVTGGKKKPTLRRARYQTVEDTY